MGDIIPCHNLLMCYSEVDVVDGNSYTELHQAAKHGHCRQIDLLIQYGANLHAVNTLGNTPLHVAASQGQIDAVKTLLKRGAKKDIVNNLGNPPNQVAIICGHHQAASVIVSFHEDAVGEWCVCVRVCVCVCVRVCVCVWVGGWVGVSS